VWVIRFSVRGLRPRATQARAKPRRSGMGDGDVTTPLHRHALSNCPDADDINAELARVVASPSFRNAPRLAAFLRFVVAMAVTGRADRIKSYTVAVEALGRDEGFDPQSDAIVRVEAGRLRKALARFYATEGRDNPLVIELPRGRYVPVFHPRAVVATACEPQAIVAALERLVERHRLETAAIAAEVAAARQMLGGQSLPVPTSAAVPARARRRSEIRPRSRCRRCPDWRP